MGTKFKHTLFQKMRRKAKISQEDLAQILRVEVSTIKMWESGARQPSASRVEQIAKVLKCKSAYLMGSRDPDDQPKEERPRRGLFGLFR